MARAAETVEISKEAREVLRAMADGAALWKGALGCRAEGYGEVSWETFDELLEARLIEWQVGRMVGVLSMPYLITAEGREVVNDGRG